MKKIWVKKRFQVRAPGCCAAERPQEEAAGRGSAPGARGVPAPRCAPPGLRQPQPRLQSRRRTGPRRWCPRGAEGRCSAPRWARPRARRRGCEPPRGGPPQPASPLPALRSKRRRLRGPPGPAAGGHGAGAEALHASSPPRQEHAWHRQSSSAGLAARSAAEQGARTSLGPGGGGGWGPSFQEAPPWGTPDHPASPPGVGHAATLPPPRPVSPQGPGRGRHPQSPPRGAGCVWARGCPVPWWGGDSPAQKGASFSLGHRPAAPSAIGQQAQGHLRGRAGSCLTGCALGTPGEPPAASPWPLSPSVSQPVAPAPHGAGLHVPSSGRLRGLCSMAPSAPSPPPFPLTPRPWLGMEKPPPGPPCGQDVGGSEAGPGLTPPRSGAGLQPGADPCCLLSPSPWAQSGLRGGSPTPLCRLQMKIPGRAHIPRSPLAHSPRSWPRGVCPELLLPPFHLLPGAAPLLESSRAAAGR